MEPSAVRGVAAVSSAEMAGVEMAEVKDEAAMTGSAMAMEAAVMAEEMTELAEVRKASAEPAVLTMMLEGMAKVIVVAGTKVEVARVFDRRVTLATGRSWI